MFFAKKIMLWENHVRILKHSSNIPLLNKVCCGLESTSDLSSQLWRGCSSEALDVCGTELTSSDSLQRVSAASSCLSCQDKCQSWKGGPWASKLVVPALLFPSLSQQAQGLSCLPGWLCPALLNNSGEFCLCTSLQLQQSQHRPRTEPFNVSLSPSVARLNTCQIPREAYLHQKIV